MGKVSKEEWDFTGKVGGSMGEVGGMEMQDVEETRTRKVIWEAWSWR